MENKTSRLFHTPSQFLTLRVNIVLVGCGGTGAHVLTLLGNMDFALKALEHPGLFVTVYDFDKVEPFNVGRQPFYPCDVGMFKGEVLVHRINTLYGTDWGFRPVRFDGALNSVDMVIGCVDTKQSRREIHNAMLDSWHDTYWLDMGNKAYTGQVVLGAMNRNTKPGIITESRLPVVTELFPEILDETIPEPDDLPSCSMREALTKQSLLINREVANQAMALLWDMLTKGSLRRHGVFVDLGEGRTSPMPVDTKYWERMGIKIVEPNSSEENEA